MSALEKTKNLVRRDLPIGLLVKNEDNPNKMSARAFDLLIDNLGQTGLTDAVLVRPEKLHPLMSELQPEDFVSWCVNNKHKFKIVGGHHRYDGATYLGFDVVPCTIILDPAFDEDQEKFQLVRMNAIRGKLDPEAFFGLYNSLSDKYADEILQDAFGFAEEAEFKKLVNQMAKTLPDKVTQEKFKEAAAEIKTIDGLSKLLNEMFTKYGDTLPFGFMVFDHGGQRSMWLRIEGKTMNALDVIGTICIDNDRTVDDVVGAILQLIAKGDLKDVLDAILKKTPVAKLPKNMTVAPTKENIAKVEAA
ncbi:ParB/RepB/Spo0J family partition protein [Hyphomicrobium sp. ghe19]|uniref:ParB/RepB/Spo0J family partition protein n=1 Tax=Hyphomicrobium sp. ghe19 TaxID=2682968 RepID=UPI001366ED41|nr:hypothetical protein HYPP_02526 [Hyphomicrobium sp. ghe19]